METEQTIIRILPLKAVLSALIYGAADHGGRTANRIVACPTQVRAWEREVITYSKWLPGTGTILTIIGIPVVAGPDDAQPELIWVSPITAAS